MNSDEMRGKWNQFKGSVKQKWGKLTDDDIKQIEGNRDVLLGKIQERYGITKEKAEQELNDWKVPTTVSEEDYPKRKVS
ncbi:MAG TPA: CsbD family protein [Candidatus Sulfotelmatobacter sp.]|nr:CsbD family protein [Candidatus Sulfotelmatobacter sp.]